jgi:hypothetical protein
VREYKGAFPASFCDGLVRSEWVAWQFGPRLTRAFEEIKARVRPFRSHESRQDRAPSRMDDSTLFRFPPVTHAAGATRSTGRRGTSRAIR